MNHTGLRPPTSRLAHAVQGKAQEGERMVRPGGLFPIFGGIGAAVFAVIFWLAQARPAFIESARPVATLPVRALSGTVETEILTGQPAVAMVWMPG